MKILEFKKREPTKKEDTIHLCPECWSDAFCIWENGEVTCYECGQPMAFKMFVEEVPDNAA